jgi:hypothetical protein
MCGHIDFLESLLALKPSAKAVVEMVTAIASKEKVAKVTTNVLRW